MIYFYLALAMAVGAGVGYVAGGMLGYEKGHDDGYAAARGLSAEQERHLGIGA